MRLHPPPISQIAPALDLILSRAYDAPHSEWRGLGRILQRLLFSSIFTKGGRSYLKAFQPFQYSPEWLRIQSLAFYIWSWSLSETGRAIILTPLILRSHSRINWFRFRFLHAASRHISNEDGDPFNSHMKTIIWAYRVIAECNSVVRYTSSDVIHDQIVRSRDCFQMLMRCAHETHEGNLNPDSDANPVPNIEPDPFAVIGNAQSLGPEELIE